LAKTASTDLTQGGVAGTLTKFAVPLAMSSILQVLYGIVDTIVAGRVVGSAGLSAVTNASFLIMFVTYLAQGVATGGNILISQYFGAKDEQGRRETTGTLLCFEMLLGAVCMVLVFLLRHQLIGLMRVPAHDEAVSYTAICSVGLLFTFGYNGMSAVLRAMGNSRWPMYFILAATVVNIALDIWFVAGLGMGVPGTAYATVAAQFITFAASAVYIFLNRTAYGIARAHLRIRMEKLRRILRLGIPSTLQLLTNGISWMIVTAFINKYGLTYSAAAGAVNKCRELLLQMVLAFSNSGGIMIGQNIGARLYDRCRQIVRVTAAVSISIAVVLILLVEAAAPLLIGIFTTENAVLLQGTFHLRIEVLCLLPYALNMSFTSAPSGAGRVGFCLLNTAVGAIAVRVLLTVVLDLALGVTGVYIACAVAMLPAFPLALWYYKSDRWTRSRAID